jgi:hypothetical protein
MIRIAITAAVLVAGLGSAASAAGPGSPPAAPSGVPDATAVVEVYVGGYYGPHPYRRYYYYRPYPWRPWYYGGPVYYEVPPAVIVAQPAPQPVWTGTGVIWLFPGGSP